jgi:hypothetical protein
MLPDLGLAKLGYLSIFAASFPTCVGGRRHRAEHLLNSGPETGHLPCQVPKVCHGRSKKQSHPVPPEQSPVA